MKKYEVEVEVVKRSLLRAKAYVEADSPEEAACYVLDGHYEGDLDFAHVGLLGETPYDIASVVEVEKHPWD